MSSLVRPDLAAFHELDTLVRNLSDQLAGYRRRALSAESRTRELELAVEEQREAAKVSALQLEKATAELSKITEALRLEREKAARTKTEQPSPDLFPVVSAPATSPASPEPLPGDRALARENAELRTRLEAASVRTRELSERLRFLRQQLATVPEK